jgi:dCMP deaminase
MFITHAPCVECSKLIISSGIKKVYWGEQYRSTEGLELLAKCGIETVQEK